MWLQIGMEKPVMYICLGMVYADSMHITQYGSTEYIGMVVWSSIN